MKTRDPFPPQGRYRHRYQPEPVDPLEVELARIEAKQAEAQARVAQGRSPDADPADLRGIPCIARGVGGTSPGTNPLTAALRMDNIRPA